MNLQQVQLTEQKVRIESLQKEATIREQRIKRLVQQNDSLFKFSEKLRGKYILLKQERGSNIEEIKQAAVFKADIDLFKHKSKLEMIAEADDAKKQRTLAAKSNRINEISGGALRIGPGGNFTGGLMGMQPVSFSFICYS